MNTSDHELDTMERADHGGEVEGDGQRDMLSAMLMTGGLDAHTLEETPGLKWFFVVCLAVQSVFGTFGSLLVRLGRQWGTCVFATFTVEKANAHINTEVFHNCMSDWCFPISFCYV